MHIRTIFAVTLICLLCPPVAGQSDERVLLRIGETQVTAEEFIRLYTKNRGIGDNPGFDTYFDQFVIFRLKVEQAIEEGLDTTISFRSEFEGYRNQLAKKYLTDNEARERLLRNAYERLGHEVNASHILVACNPDASPQDSLAAFSKALEIRSRLTGGENFSEVARATSDDPSASINGGNLGWFTSMQMVKQFEDTVYSMNPGDISQPVRTPFGYHIIMLNGKRNSSGRLKVAHIMKGVPPGATVEEWNITRDRITGLLNEVRNGASFSEIAARESDHRESASRGGELEWFGAGEIIPEFSDAAFSIKGNGEITGPVKTPYGWHLIMLIDRKPIGSFEENRSMLESRLSESHLNTVARRTLVEKLSKEYHLTINSAIIEKLAIVTDSLILAGGKKIPDWPQSQARVFSFDGGGMNISELIDIIESNIEAFNGTNARSVIIQIAGNTSSEMLIGHEDKMLEKKNPDFRYLVKEFHDGMLLFEINSREVWNKPYTDSTGLKKFYETNQNQYLGEPSVTAKIYSLREKGNLNTLAKLVRKYGNSKNGSQKIIGRFTSGGDTSLVITEDRWYRGDDEEIDPFMERRGVTTLTWQGRSSVIDVIRINDPEPRPFDEVRNEVAAAYQDYLEQQWLAQLKKRYSVWVNEKLLEELKLKYNGQH